jgi:hypothetical protein
LDKAGKQYWDSVWKARDIPEEINPHERGLPNYINYRFHEYFYRLFSNMNTQGKKFLEIGCGGSVWLRYFSMEFGVIVCGIG